MKREIRFQGKKLEYTLIQAPRRDVLIQALEGGLTRVYAPKRMPLSEIDALVGQRAGEILSMQRALAPAPLRSGECVRVEGRPRRLRLERGTGESFLTETEWVLFCPDPENAPGHRHHRLQRGPDCPHPRSRQGNPRFLYL